MATEAQRHRESLCLCVLCGYLSSVGSCRLCELPDEIDSSRNKVRRLIDFYESDG